MVFQYLLLKYTQCTQIHKHTERRSRPSCLSSLKFPPVTISMYLVLLPPLHTAAKSTNSGARLLGFASWFCCYLCGSGKAIQLFPDFILHVRNRGLLGYLPYRMVKSIKMHNVIYGWHLECCLGQSEHTLLSKGSPQAEPSARAIAPYALSLSLWDIPVIPSPTLTSSL